MQPRVTDNDDGEIIVSLRDKEIRCWSYASEPERRKKMLLAREYVEGWCDAIPTAAATSWECMGRKQALPEPGECNWPDCGCDPHATKVIESLLEQGWGPRSFDSTTDAALPPKAECEYCKKWHDPRVACPEYAALSRPGCK